MLKKPEMNIGGKKLVRSMNFSADEIVHIPQLQGSLPKPPGVRSGTSIESLSSFPRNPAHPSLSFKKVDDAGNIYSVRVGLGYRALGQMDGPEIVWFWIGPHDEYDRRV